MFIECPKCNKKFDVDEKLIPVSGRLVQCGSCQHTWLYKKLLDNETPDLPAKDKEKDIVKKVKENDIDQKNTDTITKNLNERKYEIVKKDQKTNQKNLNYFKIFIVIIISLIALIVVLDTFKVYISELFPKINDILNNLYNSLIDIFLFFKDLIK